MKGTEDDVMIILGCVVVVVTVITTTISILYKNKVEKLKSLKRKIKKN